MNITFCINTCKNEVNHLNLLLFSMARNFASRDHEILVFVDSDKDDKITNYLRFMHKETFPNLKIIKNAGPIPIGYASNINKMFEMASNDIVSYAQSDMVVGPSYDTEILKHLKPNMVLSSTRIEPPLHPPSPEKMTYDFGTDPSVFNLNAFNDYVSNHKKDQLTPYFFAPFTLYKKCWLDIGGHDVSFRRSREDSDILWRFLLNGTEIKQCWNALVYHFTCTSSRGIDWWKNNTPEVQNRTATQMRADQIEMSKFIRKWGTFKHPSTIEEANHYKYDIGAIITGCGDDHAEVLINLFPLFRKMYVDYNNVLGNTKQAFESMQNPANFLFGINEQNWNKYGKYYNQTKFEDVYGGKMWQGIDFQVDTDVVVQFNIQSALSNPILSLGLNNLQQILHDSISEGDTGTFTMENIVVTVNRFRNVIRDNIYVSNPKFDMELEIL
jgi:GT2 family glycosyltransferase